MISIYSKNNTDFEHNGDAVLIPTSCKLSATINGAWQLTIEHPYDPEERYKYIVEGATIVADIRFIRELSTTRQKFRIYNYVKGLHSVTAIAFPVAMESTYDAPIDNLVISGKTGAQAMAQLQTKTNKYTLSSDITRTGSTSFSNTNINSAIASGDEGCFIDVWGGDILYDNLTFSVKNRLGDNVAADHPVIYGRNLTDIEYKKDDSGLTTRIYPISQDGIRLNGTGYVDSSRISDYPVPHSKFMTAPYSLIDTNAGSSTSTATKTQQAVSGVSTEVSTTSQSVYATLKGNGYQPEYIKSIRNAIVEAVQTMALASVVSTSYYNLMANTIKSAMDWMGSLSQPKWEWMGSDQTGWKYGNASSYAKNMYVKIGKTWSYFGSDGNWQEPKDDSDEWDWHDAKGGTGKKYGNFTKYYAHNEYVYITVNGTIKEYWFNEQGWFEEDESGDSDYYWHGSGTGADPYWFGSSSSDYLKSCWRFIDGTYYFFDSYGYVATQKDNYQWDWNDNGDSSRAWFGNAINSEYGSDGACLKSQWQKINGTWYYFDSNGLVVDEAVSQTQTVAAFTTGMASVKTTVDSWASQLYTLLYSLMTSYANKQFASGVDLPTITITVKMADLKKTTEYADYAHLEEIKLGDSVKCIDAVHDITTENRIIGISYDILRDYNESIVIGSASATVAQMVGNAGGEAAAQGFDTSALETQLAALRNGKQDKLTAGDNITIENNVISASGSGQGLEYWVETSEDFSRTVEEEIPNGWTCDEEWLRTSVDMIMVDNSTTRGWSFSQQTPFAICTCQFGDSGAEWIGVICMTTTNPTISARTRTIGGKTFYYWGWEGMLPISNGARWDDSDGVIEIGYHGTYEECVDYFINIINIHVGSFLKYTEIGIGDYVIKGGTRYNAQDEYPFTVDKDGNIHAKSIDTIEANPSETPTEDITAIKINGQAYNLAGGGGTLSAQEITYAEWQALTEEEKMAEVEYHITDYPDGAVFPLTVENGKLCIIWQREVTS